MLGPALYPRHADSLDMQYPVERRVLVRIQVVDEQRCCFPCAARLHPRRFHSFALLVRAVL
jgi:hypothetical protein